MTDKMPPQAKMLTVEDTKVLLSRHEEFQHDEHEGLWCFPDVKRLCATLEAALKVVEAAKGLSHGEDWNYGTHALVHGYRAKLLQALAPFRGEGE